MKEKDRPMKLHGDYQEINTKSKSFASGIEKDVQVNLDKVILNKKPQKKKNRTCFEKENDQDWKSFYSSLQNTF